MSGLNDSPGTPRDEPTPRALMNLAASERDARPSEAVSRALDAAWDDLHGATPTTRETTPATWWPWVAGGAIAAAALLALGLSWPAEETERGPATKTAGGSAAAEPRRAGVPTRAPVMRPDVGLTDDQAGEQFAAVPEGPFAPPPRPGTGTERPVRPGGARPHGPAPTLASHRASGPEGIDSGEASESEPFVWLRGADQIEPGLGVQIVRVKVPRVRWDAGTPQGVLVEADLLMGLDGQPRAVRMLGTGRR